VKATVDHYALPALVISAALTAGFSQVRRKTGGHFDCR
jgi:hypothetical protein